MLPSRLIYAVGRGLLPGGKLSKQGEPERLGIATIVCSRNHGSWLILNWGHCCFMVLGILPLRKRFARASGIAECKALFTFFWITQLHLISGSVFGLY